MKPSRYRFRAIHKKKGNWVFGVPIFVAGRLYIKPEKNGDWQDNSCKKKTLGQSVGIAKYNVELFEGDIISKEGAYIVWSDKCCAWAFNFKDSKTPSVPLYYNLERVEVFGNIHKNPEMLESK